MAGLSNLSNLSPMGNDQINSDWMSELAIDNSLIGLSQPTPILDSLDTQSFATETTSPPFKLYGTYNYDPRHDVIPQNGYQGTSLTKVGFVGDGTDGIGALFNQVLNTNTNALKYSTVFREINTPKGLTEGNHVLLQGNLKNYAQGYPEKLPSSLLLNSRLDGSPLPRYFGSGELDPNIAASWFFGGAQFDPIGGSVYPSFNPLTAGFTGYNSKTTAGTNSRTVNINKENLDGSKLANTSWENFYNSNHTAKENPDVLYSYGPNVSRDNLNIRYSARHIGSVWRGDEPYIVSNIGGGVGSGGTTGIDMALGGKLLGSREFSPILRSLVDVLRLGKFMITGAGIWFMVKENLGLVELQGKQKYKAPYIPLSTILSTLRFLGTTPEILADRTSPFEWLNPKYTEGSLDTDNADTTDGITATANVNISMNGINGEDRLDDVHTSKPVNNPFEDTDKLNDWKTQEGKDVESVETGMPFYFIDLRTNQLLAFRGYLEGLTENVAPAWNSEKYIGRSEPVYMYENAERDISFTLKLFATTEEELRLIYQKLNKLTSLAYPLYRFDVEQATTPGFNISDATGTTLASAAKVRGVPPLTKFRLGELFGRSNKEVTGFIKSLSYSYPDQSPWETARGKRVPKHITAAITYQVIHNSVPSYFHTVEDFGDEFYGITGPPLADGVGTGDSGQPS